MEENNKFDKCQYGFRKNRGTPTAIAHLYETIAIAQHHKYIVMLYVVTLPRLLIKSGTKD